ncbi:MAG: glycosyl transferase family protein [Sulfuricurvum sp.]|nr:glycosyl transferase family protein [Sulfuricurvum sp.]
MGWEYFGEVMQVILIIVASVFLVSGLDDFFIDSVYWIRLLYRKWKTRHYEPLSLELLSEKPEQKIAVMIPCWDEGKVIGPMLDNMLKMVKYDNYEIFVGMYPNDERTKAAVDEIRERTHRIHEIICPHPGPTSKADNLNWIFQGIMLQEERNKQKYDIVLMHDAEDVIHPFAFKLYNYLLPRKDMVQTPVLPLEVPWYYITHWTYNDEFAEMHTKDLVVREAINGLVPSAGVGTAFSRAAIDKLAQLYNNQVFNIKMLTEDYDFALRLHQNGFSSIFVQQYITRVVNRPKWYFFGELVPVQKKEWIATRSLFPISYSNAVRQKSRWILGISLQEWRESKWEGDLPTRYTLYRDRKALLAHLVNVLAYFILIYFITYSLWNRFSPETLKLVPLVDNTGWLWILLWINFGIMIQRLIEKVVSVSRVYGIYQGIFSIPRILYANIINFHATFIAFSSFIRWINDGQSPKWVKTANVFPTTKQLSSYRRKFGDLLLENHYITGDILKQALDAQKKSGQKLGEYLLRNHLITEEQMIIILSEQYAIPLIGIENSTMIYEMPLEQKEWLAKHEAILVKTPSNTIVAAISTPIEEEEINVFKAIFGNDISLRLALRNSIDKKQEAFG